MDEYQHAVAVAAALLVATVAAMWRRPKVRKDRDNIATICPELENIMVGVYIGFGFDQRKKWKKDLLSAASAAGCRR